VMELFTSQCRKGVGQWSRNPVGKVLPSIRNLHVFPPEGDPVMGCTNLPGNSLSRHPNHAMAHLSELGIRVNSVSENEQGARPTGAGPVDLMGTV